MTDTNSNRRKPTTRELVAAKQVKAHRVAGAAADGRLDGEASDDRGRRPGQPTLSGAVFGRGRAERHRWPAYQVRQEWQVRHQ